MGRDEACARGRVAALVFPAAASAHATLSGQLPGDQSRRRRAARGGVLRFDQIGDDDARAIEVFSAAGRRLSGPAVLAETAAASSGHRCTASTRGEAYTVRWRATSSDGHTGSGVYTFGIGVTPPPPTEAYGSTGPTWTDDAARWAYFVGARAARRNDRDSGCSSSASRCRRGCRTGSTASPRQAGSRR